MEIIYATVESRELINWNREMQEAWLVVYRGEPKGTLANNAVLPRGRLWVRTDGMVLIQEVRFFDTIIRFVRLPDADAARLVARAGKQGWTLDDGEGARKP